LCISILDRYYKEMVFKDNPEGFQAKMILVFACKIIAWLIIYRRHETQTVVDNPTSLIKDTYIFSNKNIERII
jgi:hypothetical protein